MKKVGIIELSSTNVKLTIVDVLENQSFVVVETQEDKIKVASDIVVDELIKQQNIYSVTNILKTYKALLSAYGVTEVYALANC